jgi:hypothetical protein
MYRKAKQILLVILFSVLAGIAGYLAGNNHFREVTKMVQRDTLIVYDTIRLEKPAEIRYVRTKEVIKVPIRDTMRIHDTTFLLLQKEVREYRDSMYYAKVSGYDPSLDYIEVYPKTTTISKIETTTLKPSPWRYGVTVGLDYGWMEKTYVTPNVGAEVGFKKVSLGVEAGINLNVNNTQEAPIPYLRASIKYRLVGK